MSCMYSVLNVIIHFLKWNWKIKKKVIKSYIQKKLQNKTNHVIALIIAIWFYSIIYGFPILLEHLLRILNLVVVLDLHNLLICTCNMSWCKIFTPYPCVSFPKHILLLCVTNYLLVALLSFLSLCMLEKYHWNERTGFEINLYHIWIFLMAKIGMACNCRKIF